MQKAVNSDEDKRTIWCGNLSEKVTEELLYELFLQAAPVDRVKVIKARNPNQASYAFVTLKHLNSVLYAFHLLNGVSLFNRKVAIKPREGIDFVRIPPILPPPPEFVQSNPVFEQLLESGDKMLHFREEMKSPPQKWEPKNHYSRDEKYSHRQDRVKYDRHPYYPHKNQRYNQNHGYYNKRY